MRFKNKNADFFDDQFEVTYEDDIPLNHSDKPAHHSSKYDLTIDEYDDEDTYAQYDEDFDDQFEVTYEDDIPLNHSDKPAHHSSKYDLTIDEYDDEDTYAQYDEDSEEDTYFLKTPSSSPKHHSRRKQRPIRLAAPIQKGGEAVFGITRSFIRNLSLILIKQRPIRLAAPIQKGGEAVFGITRSFIRNLSLILMLAIMILMGYNFFRGSAPYGDIETAVSTNTYPPVLAAYFSIAALLIFYEIISILWAMTKIRVRDKYGSHREDVFSIAALLIFYEIISILWAMTKIRVRDKYGSHREDVGRGLTSFILLYLLSYIAFFTNRWIPESPDILKGLKGALDVFGSMHNALFGLCLAGVISCLFRKHSISL